MRPAHRTTSAGTTPRASGSASSASTSPSASSPGIPMEFQFGTNWAQLLAATPAASSARPSRWRPVRVLPRVELPRRCWSSASGASARAGTSLAALAAVRRAAGCRATSSSPPTRSCSTRSGTRVAADGTLQLADFWAFLLQPVGARAVRAQHDGRASSRPPSWWRRSARSTRSSGRHVEHARDLPAARRHRGPRRRACWSRSRRATGRRSSSPGTSRSRWRRWRATSRASRRAASC